MARLLVRDLDDDVKQRLECRARRNGRSTADEVREILREAVRDAPSETKQETGLGSQIAARFSRYGMPKEIPKLRGRIRAAKFK